MIKNIATGGIIPDKRMTVYKGQPAEIKRTYKIVDGQPVIVWDIDDIGNSFITTWQITAGEEFVFPNIEYEGHLGSIDWGDGMIEEYNSSEKHNHTYAVSKEYTIKIYCDISRIKSWAFSSQSNLKGIVIPQISTIENNVFYKCTNLEKISIPDKVTKISSTAFTYCNLLSLSELPESLCEIGTNAFNNCKSITISKIPESITSLGTSVFSTCTSIVNMNFCADIQTLPEKTFYGCTALENLNIISPNMTIIGKYAFQNCTSLKKVYVNDSITRMYIGAFSGCESLSEIKLSENLIMIEDSCFENCKALEEITLPETTGLIGDYCFRNCENLRIINIMKSDSGFRFCPYVFEGTAINTINFAGTLLQWLSVIKMNAWNYKCGEITVHCSDEDVIIPAW